MADRESLDFSLHYLGGTFGSVGQPLAPAPTATVMSFLHPLLLQLRPGCWAIHDEYPARDSSALEPADWLGLAQAISQDYVAGIRRVMVIMGTDTLAYVAAFLAEVFVETDIQLVVTGSQLPLLTPDALGIRSETDALDNLRTACQLFSTPRYGVFVGFNHGLWPAQTVQKIHTQDLDAFAGHQRAGYPAHRYQPLGTRTREMRAVDLQQRLASVSDRIASLRIGVWYATPQPLELLQGSFTSALAQASDGLIVLGYGTGNLPQGEGWDALFAQAQQQGTLVILGTQVPFGGTQSRYAAGIWLEAQGVLPAARLTLPAMVARLYWICLTQHSPAQRRRRWLYCLDAKSRYTPRMEQQP